MIVHWLRIHETMFADLKAMKNKYVLHFETFLLGDTQGLFERCRVMQLNDVTQLLQTSMMTCCNGLGWTVAGSRLEHVVHREGPPCNQTSLML